MGLNTDLDPSYFQRDQNIHLHLVSFNVPSPPNYGGVIDVFYKIKALHEAGVMVHLHCFSYGRTATNELKEYCASINCYARNLSIRKQFSAIPFIVNSRNSQALVENLNKNDYPIILEGIHCTYPIFAGEINPARVIVRTHNVEHNYYCGLARTESSIFKKIYFKIEAIKLKRYEHIVSRTRAIAAISSPDKEYFEHINPNTQLVKPFHPFDKIISEPGFGNYILIHGDLSVSENIQSTLWLIDNVVSGSQHRFVIAGKNPSEKITKRTKPLRNIELIANPNSERMTELVREAHINIVHSLYPQGFKLKLLHALFEGRHCVCNKAVVQNTGLEPICHIASSPDEFRDQLNKLMRSSFNSDDIEVRTETLSTFSNATQCATLLSMLK
ncbi:MAG: glycosyltransferase [Bacteroidales bacterium]|nr:glycosyltransferase [Bacteroidales bacterium]